MYKFHSMAALRGDGLRHELQALFERLAIDPRIELFVRPDGLPRSGPDPDLRTFQRKERRPGEWSDQPRHLA